MKNLSKVKYCLLAWTLLLLAIFIFRACNSTEVIPPNEKLVELKTNHTAIQKDHSIDSMVYIMEIQYLEAKVAELKRVKGKTTTKYVTVYEAYQGDPTDSANITEVVEVCNDLVIEQAEVIVAQDTVIATHEEYIAKQDGTIVELNDLVVESHVVLDEANGEIAKKDKKLKRTRKLGLAGFIVGVLGGIGIVIALK